MNLTLIPDKRGALRDEKSVLPKLSTWALLTSLSLGALAGCEEDVPKARERVGPQETSRVDKWAHTSSSIRKDMGTNEWSTAILANLELRTGKPHSEVKALYNKFYKGTDFDDDTAASMAYEAVLNPRVPSADTLLEVAKYFVSKTEVESRAALPLALATFNTGRTKEEIFDLYVILRKADTGLTSETAANVLLENVQPR